MPCSMDLWQKCCAAWPWTRTGCLYLRLYGVKFIYRWPRVQERRITVVNNCYFVLFLFFCFSVQLHLSIDAVQNAQYKALIQHWTQQVLHLCRDSWVKRALMFTNWDWSPPSPSTLRPDYSHPCSVFCNSSIFHLVELKILGLELKGYQWITLQQQL